MRFFVALLALAYVCDARPSDHAAHAAFFELGFGGFILNGENAAIADFPWQLSQQRLGGAWSHSCGASLLGPNKALSAAHCVDGAAVNILRVIAGLQDRSNEAGTQISNLVSYIKHPQYNVGAETFNNDIATLQLTTAIQMGANVAPANLPLANAPDYAGDNVILTGWGRTSASNVLPNVLQKATLPVIDQAECNRLLSPVNGALTGPGQICVKDPASQSGSCNGDSGGPMNHGTVPGAYTVVGVTSWGIQGAGACLPTYPSIYSRTSFYRDFIDSN